MKYISLGHFCSVALELERLGLREESSPFDWLISDFAGVICAIEEHFKDLWTYEHWAQNAKNRAYYKHLKYGFEFYHDFDQYQSFSQQLPKVKEKYDRRIKRFYQSITQPTLFIRYISDEGNEANPSEELLWIEENYDRIVSLLKSFNCENEIVFIANSHVMSSKIKLYHVERDKNDSVARHPIRKIPELYKRLKNVEHDGRKRNLRIYASKQRKKLIQKIPRKVKKIAKSFLYKAYCHEKSY